MKPVIITWANQNDIHASHWCAYGFTKVEGTTLTVPTGMKAIHLINVSPNLINYGIVQKDRSGTNQNLETSFVYGLGSGKTTTDMDLTINDATVALSKPGGVGFATLTLTKDGVLGEP